jgi:methylenetetrahydrofolate dehydrogenase (NADP+) / methenyltetrahydrofolate cyclohydrolase
MPVHEARLIEGKILAAQIQENIKKDLAEFFEKKYDRPKLVSIRTKNDPSADWYIGQQEKLAVKLGILFEKITAPEEEAALKQKIQQYSQDDSCHGIFVSMPLPSGFNEERVLFTLNPLKDVEGIHPLSLGLIVLRRARLIPSTAYAALHLIEQTVKDAGKNLKGMKAVLVGQSAIVGRPLQLLLGERRVTTTVCNTGTNTSDMEAAVAAADIVVGCAGQPGIIKGAWVREGAIVIDVGTTEVNGKLVGDVEFEEAKKRAAFITPVPGGVGPLTVTMLMQNLMHAYKWQKGL